MKTSQKGFIALLLLILIALVLFGSGAYVYMQKKQVNQLPTESPTAQITSSSTALSQLAIDLSSVTPQFIPDNLATDQSGVLGEIREIIASSIAHDYNTPTINLAKLLELIAIGRRYVVFHVPNSKEEGGVVVLDIFDLQSRTVVNHITSTPVLQTSGALIYADMDIQQDPTVSYLCAYKLDTSKCKLMPETVLQFNQGEYWAPMGNPIEVTAHTDTSFTITVWDYYQKRAREVTYQIP